MSKPTCCGQQAKWVHISHRLEYWFCEKCKKEVQEKKAPETSDDDNNIWYPGLAGYTPPSAGVHKRTTLINFSGGLSGAGSLGTQPGSPQPMGPGEIAQFTGAVGTPCYSQMHCWSSKTAFDTGVICTCGQRQQPLFNTAPNLLGPLPRPLDPTCEMPICDDPSPCTTSPAVHFWSYRRRYEADLPCNCGLRLKY